MRAYNREIWQGAQGRLHAGNNTVEIKKKRKTGLVIQQKKWRKTHWNKKTIIQKSLWAGICQFEKLGESKSV